MSTGTARPRLRWELGLGLVAFGVYLIVDVMVVPGHEAAADRNGRALVDLEQWLHLDVERVLNQWLAPREVLATIANYEYAFTYVASALLLFGWVFIRRPAAYRRTRDSFLVLNILAIACFAWYPVTPPRLLPGLGLVDTVTQGGTWGSWGSPLVTQANQFAAMPSLHVAWALWV
ncbi:MAG: phosphatase PAP2 family protein, partial [Nocardioidaceae bacterium]